MRIFLTAILLLPATFVFAQRDSIVSISYLKNNGKYVTDKDSADYIRMVSAPDSGSALYTVIEFYKNGKRKLTGKSSKIEPPVFEGLCLRFYPNGTRLSATNYKNNLETGKAYKFYPNGKLYMEIDYQDAANDGNPPVNNLIIKANYDSLGMVQVRDGNGYYKAFDDKFIYINEEGKVKNGKRDSTWKGHFKNDGMSFTEEYKDGELVRGTSVSEKGDTVTYEKTRETWPEYEGGLTALVNYLSHNIKYPTDARRNNIQGMVVLAFVVEKDGSISDIVVSKSVSPSIDQEAIRVLKKMPKWVPGRQFGRPVRTSYSVPISFTLTN